MHRPTGDMRRASFEDRARTPKSGLVPEPLPDAVFSYRQIFELGHGPTGMLEEWVFRLERNPNDPVAKYIAERPREIVPVARRECAGCGEREGALYAPVFPQHTAAALVAEAFCAQCYGAAARRAHRT